MFTSVISLLFLEISYLVSEKFRGLMFKHQSLFSSIFKALKALNKYLTSDTELFRNKGN